MVNVHFPMILHIVADMVYASLLSMFIWRVAKQRHIRWRLAIFLDLWTDLEMRKVVWEALETPKDPEVAREVWNVG